jgi:hypothetical protein
MKARTFLTFLVTCCGFAKADEIRLEGELYSGVNAVVEAHQPLIHVDFSGCDHLEVLTTISTRGGWTLFLSKEAREKLRRLEPLPGAVAGENWTVLMDRYVSMLSTALQRKEGAVFTSKMIEGNDKKACLIRVSLNR